MSSFYRIPLGKEIGELPRYYWLNEKVEVLVVKLEGTFRVFSSLCPHMGARLEWNSRKETVSCPWHGLSFCAKTLCSEHPRYRKLREHRAELLDGELRVWV